jgi:hypothetical protein
MFAAQALEVGRVGRAQRVGQRVVDIAEFGWPVATWEPTGQIPAPDEALQLGWGPVTRLWWAIAGMAHWSDGGAANDELSHERGRHLGAAAEPRRRQPHRGWFRVGSQRLAQRCVRCDRSGRGLTRSMRVGGRGEC